MDITDYERIFDCAPHPYLILKPDSQFTIQGVNQHYLKATLTNRDEIVGRGLFDVFPDDPSDPTANGVEDLRVSLEKVLRDRRRDVMGVQKYDIRNSAGSFEVKYWSPVNTPVFSPAGEIIFLIHHVEDVTEFMVMRVRMEAWKNEVTTQSVETSAIDRGLQRMEAEILLRADEVKEANRRLKAAHLELARLNEQLQHEARAKSDFVANMSHEIRTPLNGVIGMVDLLQRTPLDETQMRYTKTIRSAGKTLLSVINDILDFSKIDAGKMQLTEQPLDLAETIEEVIAPFRTSISTKVPLVASISPETPINLLGDTARLQQVIGNLISNAFKFTESGSVSLRVEPLAIEAECVQLKFQISDTGIGISMPDQQRLFQAFSQVEQKNRRYGGTGLGLVICQRLVEMMEGEIYVKSVPGQGSEFTFSIWLQRNPDALIKRINIDLAGKKLLAVDDSEDYLHIISEQASSLGLTVTTVKNPADAHRAALEILPDIITIDLDMPGMSGIALEKDLSKSAQLIKTPRILLTASSALPSRRELAQTGFVGAYVKPTSAMQLHTLLSIGLLGLRDNTVKMPIDETPVFINKKILVADDNLINRQVIGAMLSQLGIESEIVDDGLLAIQLATDQSQHFDAILMDCEMPGMDGYQATRTIRRAELLSTRRPVPIIALTAHALPEHRQQSLNAGMNDHLSKPINMATLAEVLDRHINGDP